MVRVGPDFMFMSPLFPGLPLNGLNGPDIGGRIDLVAQGAKSGFAREQLGHAVRQDLFALRDRMLARLLALRRARAVIAGNLCLLSGQDGGLNPIYIVLLAVIGMRLA